MRDDRAESRFAFETWLQGYRALRSVKRGNSPAE
jgi:hypothetical protein